MLKEWVSEPVILGFAQAGVAAAVAFAVVLLARRRSIHVEGETAGPWSVGSRRSASWGRRSSC